MTTDEGLEVHESGKPIKVDPGTYPGAVKVIEDTIGKYGSQWLFKFRLDGYPDEEPWAWASTKSGLGTETKIYEWVTILLGRPLALNEKVAKAQLIDLPCNVVISDKADIERASGFKRIVSGILPATKAQAPTPTIKDTDATAEPSATLPLADKCFCGKPVHSYSSTGAALCEKHTAEAMQE